MKTQDLDVQLTKLFGEAAIAMAPAAKQSVIIKLRGFRLAAYQAGKLALAAEAQRLYLELGAELRQAKVAS